MSHDATLGETPESFTNATEDQKRGAFEWLRGQALSNGPDSFMPALAMHEIVRLSKEIERLQVQLAGCSTAALGWNKQPARQDDYGWSRSYQDVLDLRAKYERLQESFSARSEIEPLTDKMPETPDKFLEGWGGKELPPSFHAYAWRLWNTLRKEVAARRFPGLTGEVRALSATRALVPVVRTCEDCGADLFVGMEPK